MMPVLQVDSSLAALDYVRLQEPLRAGVAEHSEINLAEPIP